MRMKGVTCEKAERDRAFISWLFSASRERRQAKEDTESGLENTTAEVVCMRPFSKPST